MSASDSADTTAPAFDWYDELWQVAHGADEEIQLADGSGAAAPGTAKVNKIHGTYVRRQYYGLKVIEVQDAQPTVLHLIDSDGHFARFERDGKSRNNFKRTDTPFKYQAKAGDLTVAGTTYKVAYSKDLSPDLMLDLTGQARITVVPGGAPPGRDESLSFAAGERLIWSSGTAPDAAVTLTTAGTQPRDDFGDGKADPTNQFGNVFSQPRFAQIAYPFCGFDPRGMNFYSSEGFLMPGTAGGQPDDHLKQMFPGKLLFEYPQFNSFDYVSPQGMDCHLPLGLDGLTVNIGFGTSRTVMMASMQDRANMWSSTLGLSAGIENLFDASVSKTYGQEAEKQQESESRYTYTSDVCVTNVFLQYPPSLDLYWTFVDALQGVVGELLTPPPPLPPRSPGETEAARQKREAAREAARQDSIDRQWKSLTDVYGTHYCHAMTQGLIKYVETCLTLKSEKAMAGSTTTIEAEAKGVYDEVSAGIKAGSEKEKTKQWSLSLTDEDSTYVEVGGAPSPPQGVAIFLDLRPIHEVLSPVYFRYNPDDVWGSLAPYIWTEVRASLEDYLTRQGVCAPTGETFKKPFNPHRLEVTVPSLNFTSPEGMPDHLQMVDGSVALKLGANNDPERYVEWVSTTLQLDHEGFGYDFWPSHFRSDQLDLNIVATRDSKTPTVTVDTTFSLIRHDKIPTSEGTVDVIDTFAKDYHVIGSATFPEPAPGASFSEVTFPAGVGPVPATGHTFTMEVTLRCTDLGALP